MRNRRIVLAAFIVGAFIITPASSQTPTKPDNNATGDPAKLNDNHKLLQELAGTWNYILKISMGSQSAPIETNGRVVRQPIMNGRFLAADFSVKMLPGADGKLQETNFQGKSIEGYDDVKQRFVSAWIDNMSPDITTLEGDYDTATKTLSYRGETEPRAGRRVQVREVIKIIDHDHYSLDWYEDHGRGEIKTIEISYTREK
jgi:hypothetical protein